MSGLAMGCGEADPDAGLNVPSPDTAAVSLVSLEQWRSVPQSEDVLAAHRPSPSDCAVAGWGPEGSLLELDTARCPYFALQQPLRIPLSQGTRWHLVMTHDALRAPEPSLAHIALLFGNDVVWEVAIPIPGPPQLYDVVRPVARDVPAGTPVMLHLHNHGQNTYRLYRLETVANEG